MVLDYRSDLRQAGTRLGEGLYSPILYTERHRHKMDNPEWGKQVPPLRCGRDDNGSALLFGVFELEGEFFDDRVGQDFARNALDLCRCGDGIQGVAEF